MLEDRTVIKFGVIAFGFVTLLGGIATWFTPSGPLPTLSLPQSRSPTMECICDNTIEDASKNNCRCWDVYHSNERLDISGGSGPW